MSDSARELLERYYGAFNAQDMETFLGLLSEDVVHDINQGGREIGREAFAAFMCDASGSVGAVPDSLRAD
jgi:steroid delta-isomerase-like uncharacterized protein